MVSHRAARGRLPALLGSLLSVALLVAAGFGSSARADTWTGGLDLWSADAFTTQPDYVTCVPTATQIMANLIAHTADHSTSEIQAWYTWGRAQTVKSYSVPGLDSFAWARMLSQYGAGQYVDRSFPTADAALADAATAMRKTGKPVGLLVAHGGHAWVLNGFQATADPLTTGTFSVTSVNVTGSLYPMQQRNGYDMPPDTQLSTTDLAAYFTAFTDSDASLPWIGQFVVVEPLITGVSGGATYHPLVPSRILDTRTGNGLSGTFSSRQARTLQVTGRGGVPAGAVAVTGNLTVTDQTVGGYLFVGPTAANDPTSSTLNFPVRDNRANGVTVALSSSGTLSVTYAAVPGATTDVVFDVTGYFTADATGATYHPLDPVRLLDTRIGNGLSGAFGAGAARTFQVSGRGGVPAGATGVTGNLTVTGQTAAGYLFIGPVAVDRPTSSTLNFPVRDNRANGVTVALSDAGTLSVTYAASAGATTQVVFDVTGYFTPDATGATYHPLDPVRLLDTRIGNGLSGAFANRAARPFQLTGRGGLPSYAIGVTGNLTVTRETAAGYLYLGPVQTNAPTSSTLNFPVGDNRANGATIAIGPGGTVSVTYAAVPGATAQVIFDLTGYFTF